MRHILRRFCITLLIAILTTFGLSAACAPIAASTESNQYVLGFGDSGAGGLIFAVDAYRDLLPFLLNISSKYDVEFVFNHIGDTKNAPYGQKTPDQIAALTKNFVGFMVTDAQSNIAVIACNTASTVVDDKMQAYFDTTYPNVPVMPIITKSAEALYKRAKVVRSAGGKKDIYVAVLATPATVASGQYQRALEKIHSAQLGKQGVTMHTYFYGPKNWVYNIEHGASKEVNLKEIDNDLTQLLKNADADKISAMGLFCTHFPFFKTEIESYFDQHGVKNVAMVSQGKLFAGKIRSKIEADIKSGKLKKRPSNLPIKTIPHPIIYSNISGDNLEEIKGVLQKISPELMTHVVFSKVEIKPVK